MANAIFAFDGRSVRTSLTSDNEPLFCLADICGCLELTNPSHQAAQIKEEFGTSTLNVGVIQRPDGSRISVPFITEPQLYFVMMRSRAQRARTFRRWVTSEVLPALRRKGSYSMRAAPARRPAALPGPKAPAMPPLMRPLEMIVRSQSGARYSAWELWHRKFGPQGWIPDWESGAETASALHVLKEGEGAVFFPIRDLCLMLCIDPSDPALIRFADDSVVATARISEAFDIPYSDRFMMLAGPASCAYIARSARSAIAGAACAWLFDCVFPCFGVAVPERRAMREAPNLLWSELSMM